MVQMQTSSQSELKIQVIDTFVNHIVHKQQSLNLLYLTCMQIELASVLFLYEESQSIWKNLKIFHLAYNQKLKNQLLLNNSLPMKHLPMLRKIIFSLCWLHLSDASWIYHLVYSLLFMLYTAFAVPTKYQCVKRLFPIIHS